MIDHQHLRCSLMAQWQRILLHCRRPRFDPWVRKFPWRRTWQLTLGFLSGESQGLRSLAGYSPQGHKELNITEVTEHARSHTYTHWAVSSCPGTCCKMKSPELSRSSQGINPRLQSPEQLERKLFLQDIPHVIFPCFGYRFLIPTPKIVLSIWPRRGYCL